MDDEWAFVAPYLSLMDAAAPQRHHDLREVFNGLRYIAWVGRQWRMMPMLALHATPANAQDRDQVGALAAAVQTATGQTVEVALVDQGYTGERPAAAAAAHGIQLEVVELADAKRGLVLLPRRWVVERSFAWTAPYRRLARDYERLRTTLEGFHSGAFAPLALTSALPILARV